MGKGSQHGSGEAARPPHSQGKRPAPGGKPNGAAAAPRPAGGKGGDKRVPETADQQQQRPLQQAGGKRPAAQAATGKGAAAATGQPSAKRQKTDAAGPNSTPQGGAGSKQQAVASKPAQLSGSFKGSKAAAKGAVAADGAGAPSTSASRGAGSAGPGPSSNWAALRASIGATGAGAARKGATATGAGRKPSSMGSNTGLTPLVAVDCEMVGVGPGGERSMLARVAVVNGEGNVLLDVYVKPKETVTDYRTKFSGVRAADLTGPKALELEEVQTKVAAMLKGRLLVGHALNNDLKALLLDHPHKDLRDTSRYPPLMRSPGPGRKPKPRALRVLAAEHLGLDIQGGEHSPVDDARAALYLYLQHRKEWEAMIKSGGMRRNTLAVKAARKAAMGAAVAAAATGALGAASLAVAGVVDGVRDANELLTPAQRRALRQGKSLKRLGVGVGGAGAMAKAPTAGRASTAGGAGAGGRMTSAGAGSGVRGGAGPVAKAGVISSTALGADEVAELVRSAAAAGAAGAGRGAPGSKRAKMARALTRDVYSDPMADL